MRALNYKTMWKYLNILLLIFSFLLGAVEAFLFSGKMNFSWELQDFILAPFVFGLMVIASTYAYKRFSKQSKWYVPTLNMNLFVKDNPLKVPFLLGGIFIALGLGISTINAYRGTGASSISVMSVSSGLGLFIAGLISVRLFSNEKI